MFPDTIFTIKGYSQIVLQALKYYGKVLDEQFAKLNTLCR